MVAWQSYLFFNSEIFLKKININLNTYFTFIAKQLDKINRIPILLLFYDDKVTLGLQICPQKVMTVKVYIQ